MPAFSKFLDRAKANIRGNQQPPPPPHMQQPLQQQSDQPSTLQAPCYADVQRYRYHHGCNIGTVFILERWMCGSMFPEGSQGSSELAAAQAWVQQEGIDAAKSRFEKHWREYISDSLLDWLRDSGKATTVRLPIGYFTLGPAYCQGTPFDGVSQVYTDAWSAVKQLVDRLQQRGIGTLIDLHGLPGGANEQEHSGTNSGQAELWKNGYYRELATRCLCFIAKEVKDHPGVTGIQVANECAFNAPGMYDWYSQVLNELTSIDSSMPVYISDGWDLNQAVTWTQGQNTAISCGNPVVIDTHLYWAFSDADKQKTPQHVIGEVPAKLDFLSSKVGSVVDRGATQVLVGEYSCVLTEDCWAKCGDTSRDELVKAFGNKQSTTYQQHTGGCTFWTLAMDWMDGGEWGFKQMTDSGAILPPTTLTLTKEDVQRRIADAQGATDVRKSQTVLAHNSYWDSNHPGTYEHRRFETGWDVGFSDAIAFFGMRAQQGLDGADTIGMLDLWILKRIKESGQRGTFVWEFEQGLREGVKDCLAALGL